MFDSIFSVDRVSPLLTGKKLLHPLYELWKTKKEKNVWTSLIVWLDSSTCGGTGVHYVCAECTTSRTSEDLEKSLVAR